MRESDRSHPGEKPELAWLDVDDLTVDAKYQRSAESDRSKKSIERIAREFSWSKFTPVIVARPTKGTKYPIIDGQHRVLAAIERGDIEQVPCCIVIAVSLVSQAESFIGINKNRVRLTPQAEFHAAVAAEQKQALLLKNILDEIGMRVPKYPPLGGMNKPNECAAIGTMMTIIRNNGASGLQFALSSILNAYPDEPGQMRSMFIKTLAEVYFRNEGKIDKKRTIEAVGELDPEHVQSIAQMAVKNVGGSVLNAMIKEFVREYNSTLPREKRIVIGHSKKSLEASE